jgi:hypothetical protein
MISKFLYLLQQKRLLKSKTSNPLKTFDKHKTIFFHIPKTGGNSIYESLFSKEVWGHRDVSYYRFVFGRKKFNRYFKFCLVRNPYQRVYSAYCFLKKGGMNENDQLFNSKHLSQYNSFEDFVINGLAKKEIINWVHFKPQCSFIQDKKGKIVVDFIGKLENMEADFNQLKKILKKENATLSHLNKNKKDEIELSNSSKHIIETIYKEDFLLFYPELLIS